MKPVFQKNLQFCKVFGHFLDFVSIVFLDFAENDTWA